MNNTRTLYKTAYSMCRENGMGIIAGTKRAGMVKNQAVNSAAFISWIQSDNFNEQFLLLDLLSYRGRYAYLRHCQPLEALHLNGFIEPDPDYTRNSKEVRVRITAAGRELHKRFTAGQS